MFRSPFAASGRHLVRFLLAAVICLIASVWMQAASAAGGLIAYLPKVAPADFFPGANRFGPPQGDPAIVPALKDDQVLGFVYLNSDFANATGYSGKPIQLLVGITPKGVVTGLKMVEHKEPIVLLGIPEKRVVDAVNKLIGADMDRVARGTAPAPQVDIVSGATVTVLVMGDSIVRSATKLIKGGRLGGQGNVAASAAPQVEEDDRSRQRRNSRLGDPGRRRFRAPADPVGRRRQQGFRKIRQCRRRRAPGGGRSGRHLHRSLCRRRRGADHRPQPARRRRIQPPGRPAQARSAGPRGRGIGALLVQGRCLCPRRHLRPRRIDPGQQQHPFPRPRPHPVGKPCSRRRAGLSRNRAVRAAAGILLRSDRALGAATAGPARGRRQGQGLAHLRSRLHAAGRLHQARAGCAGAAAGSQICQRLPPHRRERRPPRRRATRDRFRRRRRAAVDEDLARQRRQYRHRRSRHSAR